MYRENKKKSKLCYFNMFYFDVKNVKNDKIPNNNLSIEWQ